MCETRFLLAEVNLLEDLALIELPSFLILANPLEIIVDHCLGFLRLRIKLRPVVRGVVDLPVVAELEGEIVSTPNPDSGNGGVVVLAEEAHRSEGVLSQLLQTLVHA